MPFNLREYAPEDGRLPSSTRLAPVIRQIYKYLHMSIRNRQRRRDKTGNHCTKSAVGGTVTSAVAGLKLLLVERLVPAA